VLGQGRRHAQRCKAAHRGSAAALLAALGPKVFLPRGCRDVGGGVRELARLELYIEGLAG
jgi:hypothetical protein